MSPTPTVSGRDAVDVEHVQFTAAPQHPPHLAQRPGAFVVVEMVQHERGEHPVDAVVGQRQRAGERLLVSDRQPAAGRLAAGAAQRGRIRIDAQRVGARQSVPERGQQVAGAAADLQDPLAGPEVGPVHQLSVDPADAREAGERIVER
ncbi:hypothetical protein GCM10029963_04620 [Micromonospora andamanensis]